MRNISLDLIRVTEAAAIAASKWVGAGQDKKKEADGAATTAMRDRLNKMGFAAKVIIGEGEKDEAPGLFNGEYVGTQCHAPWGDWLSEYGERTPRWDYDIAVDPIDGTNLTVDSNPGAVAVMAVSLASTMFNTHSHYAMKIAYPEKVKALLTSPLMRLGTEEVVHLTANALHKKTSDVNVCILDRPRHAAIIEELRRIGCRVRLISDGDVTGAIAAYLPNTEVDLLYGIGGTPEAVITAAAAKCLGGGLEIEVVTPLNSDKTDFTGDGIVINEEQLVKGHCIFVATGVTTGSLLKGVQTTEQGSGPVTHSIFMRSESGTTRRLITHHGN